MILQSQRDLQRQLVARTSSGERMPLHHAKVNLRLHILCYPLPGVGSAGSMRDKGASGGVAWLNIALVVASVVITLIAGEFAIRLFHPSASIWRYPTTLPSRPDPIRINRRNCCSTAAP